MSSPYDQMPVGPIGPTPRTEGMNGVSGPVAPKAPGGSFVDLLANSVNEVNNMQHGAADKIQKLVTGEISNVHEVMISVEEAGVAFNLLMQIRKQLMQAWSELKRTPV
ncbi:MAG: flagellar hook-basal body complex protein FliE [Candidatus Hinthialibacter antarcticus]|nr:flagellar hook-basal body complex protein FliE [Candidatus Hinthialibacter antarcticus]